MNAAQEKKFNDLCEDVKRLKNALLGDEEMELKGIAYFTFENRRRISRLEKIVWRIVWFGGGAAGSVALIYTVTRDLIPFVGKL